MFNTSRARAIAGILATAFWLGGCALMAPQTGELRAALPAGLPERVELSEVPFFAQKEYQCGPAALAMLLSHLRLDVAPESLVDQVYIPAREGSLQVEMLAAPRRHGVLSYQLAPRFEHLLREVAAGNPVLVLQDYGTGPMHAWHYAVVVGYDHEKGEAYLRSGDKKRRQLPFWVLEHTWKKSDYWSMVVVTPDRLPATASEKDYLPAVLALERVNAGAARDAYAAVLGRWPDHLGAGIGLSNSYYKTENLQQSEGVLRRTLASHPDSVVVLNNLAQTLADQGRRDEALRHIDRAVELGGPFVESARHTRASILQKRDRRN